MPVWVKKGPKWGRHAVLVVKAVQARSYDLTVFNVKWSGNPTLRVCDKGRGVPRTEVVAHIAQPSCSGCGGGPLDPARRLHHGAHAGSRAEAAPPRTTPPANCLRGAPGQGVALLQSGSGVRVKCAGLTSHHFGLAPKLQAPAHWALCPARRATRPNLRNHRAGAVLRNPQNDDNTLPLVLRLAALPTPGSPLMPNATELRDINQTQIQPLQRAP